MTPKVHSVHSPMQAKAFAMQRTHAGASASTDFGFVEHLMRLQNPSLKQLKAYKVEAALRAFYAVSRSTSRWCAQYKCSSQRLCSANSRGTGDTRTLHNAPFCAQMTFV